MTVYITKWWVTRGIVKDTGGEFTDGIPMYYSRDRIFVRVGTDAFTEWDSAVKRVKELASAKLKSLRRSIAKIERIAKDVL